MKGFGGVRADEERKTPSQRDPMVEGLVGSFDTRSLSECMRMLESCG